METKFNGYKIVSFNFPYEHFEATQNGHIEQLTLAAPFVQKELSGNLCVQRQLVFYI